MDKEIICHFILVAFCWLYSHSHSYSNIDWKLKFGCFYAECHQWMYMFLYACMHMRAFFSFSFSKSKQKLCHRLNFDAVPLLMEYWIYRFFSISNSKIPVDNHIFVVQFIQSQAYLILKTLWTNWKLWKYRENSMKNK